MSSNPGRRLHLVPRVAPASPAPSPSPSPPSPTPDRGELSLEVLYEAYAPYVGAVASRLLGRAAEVEDVVQDVFTLALRGLKRREEGCTR